MLKHSHRLYLSGRRNSTLQQHCIELGSIHTEISYVCIVWHTYVWNHLVTFDTPEFHSLFAPWKLLDLHKSEQGTTTNRNNSSSAEYFKKTTQVGLEPTTYWLLGNSVVRLSQSSTRKGALTYMHRNSEHIFTICIRLLEFLPMLSDEHGCTGRI